MVFDIETSMAVGSMAAAMSAIFIFYAWSTARDGQKLLWWVAGDVFYAVSIALIIAGTMPGHHISTAAGSVVYAAGTAMFLMSARLFNGQRFSPVLFGVMLIAPFANLVPPLATNASMAMSYGLANNALLMLATGLTFWQGRSDGHKARGALIVLCLVQGAVFGAGAFEAATGTISAGPVSPDSSLFGLVHFTSMLFLLGTAVFVVALAREQSEARQKRVAETDSLTGVARRGAFMLHSEAVLQASSGSESPPSLILFDLDGFKSINDRFGHAMGDRVLREFGDTVKRELREGDRVGRLGGEEFAVILPETGLNEACAIAERIRMAFEARCETLDDVPVNGTVSAGVTTARPSATLDALLASADKGLYAAKANGRNRVERPRPTPDESPLERVA